MPCDECGVNSAFGPSGIARALAQRGEVWMQMDEAERSVIISVGFSLWQGLLIRISIQFARQIKSAKKLEAPLAQTTDAKITNKTKGTHTANEKPYWSVDYHFEAVRSDGMSVRISVVDCRMNEDIWNPLGDTATVLYVAEDPRLSRLEALPGLFQPFIIVMCCAIFIMTVAPFASIFFATPWSLVGALATIGALVVGSTIVATMCVMRAGGRMEVDKNVTLAELGMGVPLNAAAAIPVEPQVVVIGSNEVDNNVNDM